MITEIKLLNEDAGNRMKTKVYIAMSVLSIPFIIRSIYNFLSAIFNMDSEIMVPSISNNDWIAPLVYLIYIIFADILPITVQLVSIIIVLDRGKYYFQGTMSTDGYTSMKDRHFSLPAKDCKYRLINKTNFTQLIYYFTSKPN